MIGGQARGGGSRQPSEHLRMLPTTTATIIRTHNLLACSAGSCGSRRPRLRAIWRSASAEQSTPQKRTPPGPCLRLGGGSEGMVKAAGQAMHKNRATRADITAAAFLPACRMPQCTVLSPLRTCAASPPKGWPSWSHRRTPAPPPPRLAAAAPRWRRRGGAAAPAPCGRGSIPAAQ